MKIIKAIIILLSFLLAGSMLMYVRKYCNNSNIFQQKKIEFNLQNLSGKKNIIPIAVIGSGCAGLSAALYGARSSIYTVVFLGSQPGGQLTTTSYVENWPGTVKSLGSQLIDQTKKQAESFGAQMVKDTVETVDLSSWPFKLVTQDGIECYALSLIIATGSTPKILGVPGEKEFWGKGVTTCAICDAPYYKDRKVVVVGGGDSAIEEATLLSSFAKEITMLVRGDSMRAAPSMQARLAQTKNIKVLYNTKITKVSGNKEVTSIEIENTKKKQIENLPIDGIFLAIGHEPNSKIFKQFLALDSHGYISLAPRTQQASLEGVFAAGDVSDPEFKQAGVAAGDGIKAALGAVNFLKEHGFNDEIAKKYEKNFFEQKTEGPFIEIKTIKTIAQLNQILKSNKKVVIDFYAPWCPSCMQMLPVVSAVATSMKDKVLFVKNNISDSPVISKHLNVASVPWLLVFSNGKEIARTKDIMSKRQMTNYLSQILKISL